MALSKLTKNKTKWTTFKLKLAGAISRSLLEKIVEGGISITDFGADPAHDDNSAYIQRALEVVSTLGLPHTLVIPDGHFKFKGLVIPEGSHNVKLIGTSWDAVLENIDTTGKHALHFPSTNRLAARTYGIHIEGFTLLGNAASGNGIQIEAGGFYDRTIDNIDLEASTSLIHHMRISGHGKNNIQMGRDSSNGCGNSTMISSCLLEKSGRTGLLIIGQTNLVTATGNVISANTQDGVEINQVASTNNITQNIIMDNGRYGVYAFRAEQPLITYNGFNRNAGGAVVFSGDAYGSVKYIEAGLIDANLFGDNGGSFELSLRGVKGCNVKNNYFYYTGSTDTMIYVSDNVEGVMISGNHWKDLPPNAYKVRYKDGAIETHVTFDDDVREDSLRQIELKGKIMQYITPAASVFMSLKSVESGVSHFSILGNGKLQWSDGTNPTDVSLERHSGGRLRLAGMLDVSAGVLLSTTGDLTHRTDGARLYYKGNGDLKLILEDGQQKTVTLT